ncbi:elongator complex protein 4-like [Babylonia areolata]|uniref:elongator complex protein 4-like n=1 Tax=Babylonia areolata TaxID=304850 RepID=UPI003FD15708
MAASTSFNKKVKAKLRQIPGAKPSIYNNQLLVSTGIPSLDSVLGGGVAVGTVLLIEEDVGGRYAEVMTRYFLAEGVVSQHALSVVSASEDPQRLLQRLPAPVEDSSARSTEPPPPPPPPQGCGDAGGKMAIAWRYQNQPKVQSAGTSTLGHYFNLSQTMEADRLRAVSVDCTGFSDLVAYEQQHLDNTHSTHCRYQCVLQRIRKRIEEGNFITSAACEKRNILRIAIPGLGSTLWGSTGGATEHTEEEEASLLQFLLALRATLRTSFSVCLLTIPTYLFQTVAVVKRVQQLCDTVVRLQSFSTSLKTKNPAFRDYSGLLHLVKVPCVNQVAPHLPETLDLAFRCRRKKFTVEKLHLPPELSTAASRDQEDPHTSSSSWAAGTNPLDF